MMLKAFPEVSKLHPDCQGALLSLVLNRGNRLTDSPKNPELFDRIEMRQIKQDLESGQIHQIPSRFISMKRLWVDKGLDGLLKRRNAEAELFKQGLLKQNEKSN